MFGRAAVSDLVSIFELVPRGLRGLPDAPVVPAAPGDANELRAQLTDPAAVLAAVQWSAATLAGLAGEDPEYTSMPGVLRPAPDQWIAQGVARPAMAAAAAAVMYSRLYGNTPVGGLPFNCDFAVWPDGPGPVWSWSRWSGWWDFPGADSPARPIESMAARGVWRGVSGVREFDYDDAGQPAAWFVLLVDSPLLEWLRAEAQCQPGQGRTRGDVKRYRASQADLLPWALSWYSQTVLGPVKALRDLAITRFDER
jgi:hypothetical protein